ncbi:MAG: nucleotide-binding protein [Chitinivibrionia bacterium]|nr:nucleotide-binding protein [Chitinivibrionia bacterium]
MKKIVLISCCKTQSDNATKVRDLYVGSLFKKSLFYAESLKPDYIFVLSSKNGLLTLDDNVERYDVVLKKQSTTYKKEWGQKVIDKLKEYADLNNDKFIILGSKDYVNPIKDSIKNMELPLGEMPIGKRLQWLGRHTSNTNEEATKIFIVHGHDEDMLNDVKSFIEELGFKPIILREQANKGQTIIQKIEKNSNVRCAIILYSPCDLGKGKDELELKVRPRQNVVFEHGYFMGKLGRENVITLVKGLEIKEILSDISGLLHIKFDDVWQEKLNMELCELNFDI